MDEQLFYTEVYGVEDFEAARRKKKVGRAVIIAVSAVFVLLNLITYLQFLKLPYGADRTGLIALHAAYIFSYMSFLSVYGIRYGRIKNYCRTLEYMQRAGKEEDEGIFLYYTEEEPLKDSVEYVGVMLLVHRPEKEDDVERRLLYDKAKPPLEFKEGDRVAYVAQSSVITQYRIVERNPQTTARADGEISAGENFNIETE